MKLTRKQDYLVLIVAVLLIIIFVILAIIITLGEISGPEKKTEIGSKPIPAQTSPRIKYEFGTLGRAFEKLVYRVALSPSDQAVKNRLLNQAGESGIIIKTDNYYIEYVKSMDDFEIEILTTNIDLAKKEAEAYLKSQGFSNKALCNLPVRFHLNFEISKTISPQTIFNPLAKGC